MITTVSEAIPRRAGSSPKPSIAEVIEIGGVIIPSASNAAPPSMAGMTSHFFRAPHQCIQGKSAALTPVISPKDQYYIFDRRL